MITARDIAEMVGVSVSTVGRAMADDPRISWETRSKVRKAAEKMGYVGSLPARMVRGATSNLIGLLVPEISNIFYATIAQALSEVCSREGYRLVLSLTRDSGEEELKHIRELVGARSAGIIIVPTAKPAKASVQLLGNIPHVQLLRRVSGLGDQWFGINDGQTVKQATEHLAGLGHRRIAYIGGTKDLSTGATRLEGFIQGCEAAGIEQADRLIVLGETSRSAGANALLDMMRYPDPPTAVIAGSVNVSDGLIDAIEASSIDVPTQMSVIGFGDASWCEWWRGGLTTIKPPIDLLATNCALWFLNRIREHLPPSNRQTHVAMASAMLVLRNTTGPRSV